MENQMKEKTIKITLSDARPIRIVSRAWPIIAMGWWGDDRRIPCQSTRECTIRVRRHADGRYLITGIRDSCWASEATIRSGVLLESGVHDNDIVSAIHVVGEEIGAPQSCIRECIADLPEEELR